MKSVDVAVVGATGVVGRIMLDILAARNFPVGRIHALASARSVGKSVAFGDAGILVEDLAEFDFSQVQLALFSAGAEVARACAPKATAAGCTVIDNSSAFRECDDVPLVVPEVNPHCIAGQLLSNPNCSTIQMVVALQPLHQLYRLREVVVATYQSVSGIGRDGVDLLQRQTRACMDDGDEDAPRGTDSVPPDARRPWLAFNALPLCGEALDGGYTTEEMKLVHETRKILGDDSIIVQPTCVRVPVFYGHSEAIVVRTHTSVDLEQVRATMAMAPGVVVLDDSAQGDVATAVEHGEGSDTVFVSRIRSLLDGDDGLSFWVVADNSRKGAALNAVQIAEHVLQRGAL